MIEYERFLTPTFKMLRKLLLTLLVSLSVGLCRTGPSDAKQCVPVTEKPKPTLNTLKKTTPDGKGICLIASMKAYLEIGDDEYVKLNGGHTVGNCVQNSTLLATSDQFVFEFTCGSIFFYLKRVSIHTLWRIEAILVVSPVFNLFHLRPIDDTCMQVRNADHSYRCEFEQTILIRESRTRDITSVSLVLSNITIEAFRDTTKPHMYQQPDHCPLDGKGTSWGTIFVWLSLLIIVATGIYLLRNVFPVIDARSICSIPVGTRSRPINTRNLIDARRGFLPHGSIVYSKNNIPQSVINL